jgi:ferredoxin
MKAEVDANKCIGCGLCEATCPPVFLIDYRLLIIYHLSPLSSLRVKKGRELEINRMTREDGQGTF